MSVEPQAVRKAAQEECRKPWVAGDRSLAAVARAEAGSPVLVRSPEGEASSWMVPFVAGPAACGYARVELSGRVSQVAAFGAHPEDRAGWIPAGYFERPPPELLEAVRARYAGTALSEPVFSFDRSPARWAWMVRVEDRGVMVFIQPRGWYERRPGPSGADREL